MEMAVLEIVINQGHRRGPRQLEQKGLGWLQLCKPKGRRASRDSDGNGEVCHASWVALGRQMRSRSPNYRVLDILAGFNIIFGFVWRPICGPIGLFAAG
jgi:hypothetical protein